MSFMNQVFIEVHSDSNELVGLPLVSYWWEQDFYRYYQIIKCSKLEAHESSRFGIANLKTILS